jgi:hypothetical protein
MAKKLAEQTRQFVQVVFRGRLDDYIFAHHFPYPRYLRRWQPAFIDFSPRVDNRGNALKVGAPLPEFESYETHSSTIQTHAKTSARVSRPDEDQRRTRHSRAPAPARSQAFTAEGCRFALRASYAGVVEYAIVPEALPSLPPCFPWRVDRRGSTEKNRVTHRRP